ncbi:splicing factor, Prp19-binding domain-containing protein [Piptocephalis cylindrospora]|uniref:Splicing factor, Prp19-binding domain-containing protein n=1 Tax=Piptocephalis cylindrospora TaxID=1907219 RepID=A0A4V1IXZ6_9FUNG|nr:splicing factor, Prp19-binding domain-containing protein [Piptocephalis cylindrospora]|eukprot:RKP12789.1 splicing factor, Prp19-binding domain-containing protein [Piptocephalis cylindrospora]
MSSRQAASGTNARGQNAPKPARVHRYRAGQLPTGVSLAQEEESTSEEDEGEDEEEAEEEDEAAVSGRRGAFTRFGHIRARPGLGDEETSAVASSARDRLEKRMHPPSHQPSEPSSRASVDPGKSIVAIDEVSDPRLRRILQAQRLQHTSKGGSDRSARGRGEREGEGSEEDGEDEAMLARRQRIRQRALASRRQEEDKMSQESQVEPPPSAGPSDLPRIIQSPDDREKVSRTDILTKAPQRPPSDLESDDTEEEDESDEEEEEEEEYQRPMFKPVFKSKSKRHGVSEKVNGKAPEDKTAGAEEDQSEERYKESQRIITEAIRQSRAGNVDITHSNEVDDTDGLDEEGEFQAWRLRELKRIMQDREDRETAEQERAEVERRRNLTEEERVAEDAERAQQNEQSESKGGERVFGQKYYHKGAFYQDTGKDLLSRDYQVPTEDEPKNRESLPKPLQAKKLGFAGQTKWTHLSAEDTTKKDAAWYVKSVGNKRAVDKMGGMKQEFDRPSKRKQRP